MDKHYQNWTTAYIKSIREMQDRQDEALVADHRAIVKQILDLTNNIYIIFIFSY